MEHTSLSPFVMLLLDLPVRSLASSVFALLHMPVHKVADYCSTKLKDQGYNGTVCCAHLQLSSRAAHEIAVSHINQHVG
eukprot:1138434-Pelagomonas_calceolata.AAC.7